MIVLAVLIVLILLLIFQPGNEGLDLRPQSLAENDIGIYLINANSNGTEFQIEIANELRQTIYYADTFEYYCFIYNSSGDQIDTLHMEGYFQQNNSDAIIECEPDAKHILNEAINPDDYDEGTYYVSYNFHIRDYYDDVFVYSSERMEFRV